MTQKQHSLSFTPDEELLDAWLSTVRNSTGFDKTGLRWLTEVAAKWGADRELKACCEWLKKRRGWEDVTVPLRAARRPKPPSLKEQALIHFDSYAASFETSGGDSDLIRRALESIPDQTSEGD